MTAMNLFEYRAKRKQDPEYQAAAADLKLTMDLANRILDLRIEHKWSQAELGAMIQASGYYINELESGLTSPTVRMLEALAEAFGAKLKVELG